MEGAQLQSALRCILLSKKHPVSCFDPAVWDIVEQASPSLKLFIVKQGGLLRALANAKTKDFVVNLADDTFSLKEFMNSTQPQPIASLDVQPSATYSHKAKGLVKLGIVKRTSTKAVFVECPGLDTIVWCPVASIICPDSGRYLDSGATVAGKLNVGDKVEVCLKRQALRNDCSWAAQSTKLIDEAQPVAAAATTREFARSDPSSSAITSLSSSLLSHSSEGRQSCSHCVDYKKLQEPGLLNERKSSTTMTNGAKKKGKQGVHNQTSYGLRRRRLMSYGKAVLFCPSGGPQATSDERNTCVAPDSLAQSCEKCCVNNQRPVTSQLRQRCFSSARKLSNAGRGSRNSESSCVGHKQTNRYGPPNRTVWLLSTVFFIGLLLLRTVQGAPLGSTQKLILQGPKNVTVLIGNKAVFHCQTLASISSTNVNWLLNGSQLRVDGLRVLRFRNQNNSLFLLWAAFSDQGVYTCVVRSDGSVDKQSAKLTVLPVDSEKDKGNAAFRKENFATTLKHYDKAIKNAGSGATAAFFSNKAGLSGLEPDFSATSSLSVNISSSTLEPIQSRRSANLLTAVLLIASVLALLTVVCCTFLVDRICNDVNLLVARWRQGFDQWLPHASAGIADFRRRKNGGTAVGQDTMMRNNATHTINTRHQCITCQKEYEMNRLEELRDDDYLSGRNGPQPDSSLFGAVAQTSQPATNLFDQSEASGPASAGLFSFGAAAPASTAAPSLFGDQSTVTGGLFGAAATRPSLFGGEATASGGKGSPGGKQEKGNESPEKSAPAISAKETKSETSQLTATISANESTNSPDGIINEDTEPGDDDTASEAVSDKTLFYTVNFVVQTGRDVQPSGQNASGAASGNGSKENGIQLPNDERNGGQDGSNGAANGVLALRDLPPVRVPAIPCIGIVSAVESPHCIYVQQMTHSPRIMQLAADLWQYVAANQQASQTTGFVETPGAMFVFLKRPGDAYRCKLLPTITPPERFTPYEGTPTLYRVLLVDYGVELKATAAQLWPLPTEFCADPPYALRCAMVEVGDESAWLAGKDRFAFCYLMQKMYTTTGFSVICVFSPPHVAGVDASVQLIDPQWDNQRVFDLLREKLGEPFV